MKRLAPLALLAFVAPALADTKASAWPPKLTFGDGTEASLTGNFAWDANRVDADGTAMDDDQDWRRKELGVSLKRKGLLDFTASYDFGNGVEVFTEAKNLTNSAGVRYYGSRERTYEYEKFGYNVFFGVRFKL